MNVRQAQEFALSVAPATAAVANFCDHVEHNESVDRAWVLDASDCLRTSATALCVAESLSLVDLYAERLGVIEARNVLATSTSFDGRAAATEARTWRDLQIVQSTHDRYYHPDVVGLAKIEQLRHYALHLSKIVGAFADAEDIDDLLCRRLPDTVLFAIKLPTVMGMRMSDDPVPGRVQVRRHDAISSRHG